jgi:hypothetical protein
VKIRQKAEGRRQKGDKEDKGDKVDEVDEEKTNEK